MRGSLRVWVGHSLLNVAHCLTLVPVSCALTPGHLLSPGCLAHHAALIIAWLDLPLEPALSVLGNDGSRLLPVPWGAAAYILGWLTRRFWP